MYNDYCKVAEISFDLINKTFVCDCYGRAMNINIKTLKAINQQCKELGVVIMDNSLFEIDNMCHALGFDPNKIRKGQRVFEYYRNFFVASGKYKESWEKLVKWGDAAKASNAIVGSYYYVTQKGLDFLSSIYKIKFKPMK